MVKFVYNSAEIPHRWDSVAFAHWSKYPHPQNPNVLCVDILDRRTDLGNTNKLQTTRLVTCIGAPSYITRWAPVRPVLYNCEQSSVDRVNKSLTLQTFNISLLNLFNLYEETIYTQHPDNPAHTLLKQQYRIDVKLWGVSQLVETWASRTCVNNAQRGIDIVQSICKQFEQKIEVVKSEFKTPNLDVPSFDGFTSPTTSTFASPSYDSYSNSDLPESFQKIQPNQHPEC